MDEILARDTGALFYHQDRIGNVSAVTNALGQVVEQYRYDAFGAPEIRSAPVSSNPNGTVQTGTLINNRFLFTGREWAARYGFYEYRNRAYNPRLGRFMSEDPMGFKAGDRNLFRYCAGDPVNKTDPMGLRLEPIHVPDDLDAFGRAASIKAEKMRHEATDRPGMERNVAVFRDRQGNLSLSDPTIGTKDKSGKLRSMPPDPPKGSTRPASGHDHPNGTGISGEDRVFGDKYREIQYAKGRVNERWRYDADPRNSALHIGGRRESWSERTQSWVWEKTPSLPKSDRGGDALRRPDQDHP